MLPSSLMTKLIKFLIILPFIVTLDFHISFAQEVKIDGAIIVVEYANRRASEGISKKKVFSLSAQKMFIPVLASTLTTLAAFFPLIFWPGVAGEFMFFLPVTLLAVLSSSLLMALIFIPTIGGIFGNDKALSKQSFENLNLLENGDLKKVKGLQGKYIDLIEYCLDNPKKLITLTFVFLIFIQLLYFRYGKGIEYFPPIEPDYAEIIIHARGNFSPIEKDEIVKKVEKEIIQNEFIRNAYSRSGMVKGQKRSESEDVVGSIKVELIDWKLRPKAKEILDNLKQSTSKFPGIYIEFIEKKDGPPKDRDIEIYIVNNDVKKLSTDTLNLFNFLKEKSWIKNIDSDINNPGIEWELKIDREQADKHGVDIQTIGNAIQMLTHGLKVTEFMPSDSDEEIDIVVKYEKKFRTLDELDEIFIEGKNGAVSLSLLINRIPKNKIGKVARYQSLNSKTIKFDVEEGIVSNNKVKDIENWLNNNSISFQSKVIFSGEEEDQKEAKDFLIKAFLISLFLITIILIATFNSFYYCLIILSAVIFSTIGVMIGLLVSSKPFGIVMSGIGIIALAGIVVNNNIVLLDTYKFLRAKGENIREAIIRTGAQRLRPVLLTTLTTFFGLIPMAIGLNINFLDAEINFGSPSSQWWIQLSNAMVFGVMFSFILTLIITPCLIYIGEKSKILSSF